MKIHNVSEEFGVVRENHLSFLYELFTQGIKLIDSDIALLKKHGYIKEEFPIPVVHHGKSSAIPASFRDMSVKNAQEENADRHIDIIDEDIDISGIISEEDYNEKKENLPYLLLGNDREITKEDWMPASATEHKKAFVEWIDSLLEGGFSRMKRYRPFMIYCQQADIWLSRNYSETNFSTQEEKDEYWDEEMLRYKENSMYFLDRQLTLKEGDMATGSRRYESKPVHRLIAFLYDCGYSMEVGKPRQIAATSTFGGLALKTLLFDKNTFIKFVTQDKETGVEIFEDKIKYPFGELPDDLKPDVLNDRDNLFKLGNTFKKGTKRGVNSKLQVVAPSVSAINGGSPQKVIVDEAGYIGILGKMLKEARPTMFMQDFKTGKLTQRRQLIVLGTGGEMDKGGKAYEEEFMSTVKMWRERNFSSGIIPIFLDWTTRPGITQEFYDKEKEVYYAVEGPDAQAQRIQFHQTYPASIEDMFLTSLKTLVGIDYIITSLDRIRKFEATRKPQYGYFEPIYDTTKPAPEYSDTPYEITGVNFIPTNSESDPRTTCTIFQHPKKWLNRYFQGTDPIASDNGLSNMGSAIWDAYYCTVSAVVNHRDPDYKYTFLQCALLGIYYNTDPNQKAAKELLEANIGAAYRGYKENKGLWNSLVFNTELPAAFRVQQGTLIGIDNKGLRNKLIIDKLYEVISAFGDKIYIDEVFIQLKTFVCTVTSNGRETWGPIDRRVYKDDVLFAVVFAYICSMCYSHKSPVEIDAVSTQKMQIRHELRRDENWNLVRVAVRKPV